MSDADETEEVEAPPPPKVVQHAELDAQYNLPIRAEKFRCYICQRVMQQTSDLQIDSDVCETDEELAWKTMFGWLAY